MGTLNTGTQAIKTIAQVIQQGQLAQLVHLPSWLISLVPPHTFPHQPWFTYTAISWLNSILTSEMKIFEYGSGFSTLYYLPKVKEVVSIEHDKNWYRTLKTMIQDTGYKCNLQLVLPQKAKKVPYSGKSFTSQADGKYYERYVKAIDAFPNNYFDLVVVDGRSRPSCALYALKKIKKSGYLILDDSQRELYKKPLKALDKYERIDFWGFKIRSAKPSQTTVWKIE